MSRINRRPVIIKASFSNDSLIIHHDVVLFVTKGLACPCIDSHERIPPMIGKQIQFIKTDIWSIRSRELPKSKLLWVKLLRIIILAVRRFGENDCLFRASALTFYSLLSIVPVFAMAFGIAKGFGFQNALEKQLLARFQGQEEVIVQITNFARSLLENTKGGVIAGIGIMFLFWTVIRLLGNIENSFNHIWEVKESRNLTRKISDYLSAIFVCPLLLLLSGAVTVVIMSRVKLIVGKIAFLGAISSGIFFIFQFLPYVVIWILFTFIYMFMPNKKIHFTSGIFAGIVGGTLYQFFQWIYFSFQIGVAKYNAIYGSFAALPLFLVWLQLSWMIVLFGAEISFAHQNEETFEFEPDYSAISYRTRKLLVLQVVHLLVKDFSQGKKPLSAMEISNSLEIPVRLIRDLLKNLVDSKIISVIMDNHKKRPAYQPAQDIDLFTIKYVIDSLELNGNNIIPAKKSTEFDNLARHLKAFEDVIEKSPANMRLKEI